jgi:hypothetical protein
MWATGALLFTAHFHNKNVDDPELKAVQLGGRITLHLQLILLFPPCNIHHCLRHTLPLEMMVASHP